jgi:amino acid transporter
MGVKRLYWAGGLLLLGLVSIGLSLGGHWYVVESDLPPQPGSAFMRQWGLTQQQADIDDPRQQYHTSLWTEVHFMIEGSGGTTHDHERVPFIAQVLTITQTFFIIGLVGLSIAVVGLLFRARGIADGKGVVAAFATISLAFLAFGVVYFAFQIPGAYEQQLNNDWGSSPELGFYTFGSETEDGSWSNVFSGPGLGWYAAAVGVVALVASFALVYAQDLRRASEALLDDEVAADRMIQAERRPHVLDRIRQGGDGE